MPTQSKEARADLTVYVIMGLEFQHNWSEKKAQGCSQDRTTGITYNRGSEHQGFIQPTQATTRNPHHLRVCKTLLNQASIERNRSRR